MTSLFDLSDPLKLIGFPEDGQALREEGLDRVESNSHGFVDKMREVAADIALRRGWVNSDDLRLYAEAHDLRPHHPNAWGSVFRGSRWNQVGWMKSTIPSNHARSIGRWVYLSEREG